MAESPLERMRAIKQEAETKKREEAEKAESAKNAEKESRERERAELDANLEEGQTRLETKTGELAEAEGMMTDDLPEETRGEMATILKEIQGEVATIQVELADLTARRAALEGGSPSDAGEVDKPEAPLETPAEQAPAVENQPAVPEAPAEAPIEAAVTEIATAVEVQPTEPESQPEAPAEAPPVVEAPPLSKERRDTAMQKEERDRIMDEASELQTTLENEFKAIIGTTDLDKANFKGVEEVREIFEKTQGDPPALQKALKELEVPLFLRVATLGKIKRFAESPKLDRLVALDNRLKELNKK